MDHRTILVVGNDKAAVHYVGGQLEEAGYDETSAVNRKEKELRIER